MKDFVLFFIGRYYGAYPVCFSAFCIVGNVTVDLFSALVLLDWSDKYTEGCFTIRQSQVTLRLPPRTLSFSWISWNVKSLPCFAQFFYFAMHFFLLTLYTVGKEWNGLYLLVSFTFFFFILLLDGLLKYYFRVIRQPIIGHVIIDTTYVAFFYCFYSWINLILLSFDLFNVCYVFTVFNAFHLRDICGKKKKWTVPFH